MPRGDDQRANLHVVDKNDGEAFKNDGELAHKRLLKKMESIANLSEEEREGLRLITGQRVQLRAYEDVVREGDRPNSMCLLLDGFLCRYKVVEDGNRQIMAFYFPGDTPDAMSLFIDRMDHSLGTLVPSTILRVPHQTMFEVFDQHPRVGHLFWRDTLIDAAVFREWMVGLGRREAYGRLARLLCEVMTRMRALGLATDGTCELPLTQAELGDATGLSNVHVSRTLGELRNDNLLEFKGGSLTILDWNGLAKAADFDASYLHLKANAA